MLPELSAIRKRRLALGFTQKKLADLCYLSQSVLTKIEREKINPSYDTARKIFETLHTLEERSLKNSINQTASDVMTRTVTFVKSTDMVNTAADIMLKKNFSQLPVLEGERVVGRITDKILITSQELKKRKVEEVMSETFPILPLNTRISTLQAILSDEPAILISDKKGKVIGIVTKHDLIKAISHDRNV
jgi:predicted transcriptional regulator